MKKKFFSLRRQMVLVYLLGGALPMLLIIGILIGTQRSTMLEQAATAAVTELTMLKNTLNSQCGVLVDVSKRMYKHKKRCSASALHLRKCYFTLSHCPMQRPAQYILRGADRRS